MKNQTEMNDKKSISGGGETGCHNRKNMVQRKNY